MEQIEQYQVIRISERKYGIVHKAGSFYVTRFGPVEYCNLSKMTFRSPHEALEEIELRVASNES